MKRRVKLTVVAFCRQVTGKNGSKEPLFPLLTEGRHPTRSTEKQFSWKRCSEKKYRMARKK
jgi:hypothetical protein